MNEYTIISLIALSGFLILALSALRGRQIDFRRGVWLVVVWVVIFAVVALVASALLGE